MIRQCIKISLAFILLAAHPVFAEAVYTWMDADGVLHISEKEPPPHALQMHRMMFGAVSPSKIGPAPESADEKARESGWLRKVEHAKRERGKADAARKTAEAAIAAANRLKAESDTFIAPWRSKKRIRRPMLRQIERRIQEANAAIERAETLVETANEAELSAQAAEKDAQRAAQELFDRYQHIVSN